jgi:ubiquinone/menaquinone biosynthesis C-methylase UbiE
VEKQAFDPARFKEQERAGFNYVADRYEQTLEVTRPVIDRMITLAELEAGMRVLDVATGPGIIARRVGQLVGLSGSVLGVDIAEAALEQARQKAAAEGLLQVTFEVADAENLPYESEGFDRVFCSLGLMHFPDAEKALQEFKRVLKPGGKLVVSVWAEEDKAPYISVALRTLSRNFPPPKVERPSMFRFGNPQMLAKMVEDAGFFMAQTEPVTLDFYFPNAASYWQKFLDTAGITAIALAKQPPEVQVHLAQDVATDLAPYQQPDGYHLLSTLMLVSATA